MLKSYHFKIELTETADSSKYRVLKYILVFVGILSFFYLFFFF